MAIRNSTRLKQKTRQTYGHTIFIKQNKKPTYRKTYFCHIDYKIIKTKTYSWQSLHSREAGGENGAYKHTQQY